MAITTREGSPAGIVSHQEWVLQSDAGPQPDAGDN